LEPASENSDEPLSPELRNALREVPSGTLALTGLTVFLLLAAWFVVYLFIFIPRGPVG